jgi:peptidoglycan/LPS O-acetylase OafA/YrhL
VRHGEHRADLDGLRGLAIALVVIGHAHYFPVELGYEGVAVFFVLSGFLITSLLMAEDQIDVRNFYLRRALRLGPALAVAVTFVVIVGLVGGWTEPWQYGVIGAATYSSNWLALAGFDLGPLNHTWSLAIEEQFYWVWPLVLILVPRRILPWVVAVFIGIGAAVAIHVGYGGFFYFSTVTNAAALLGGCLIALLGVRLRFGALGIALVLVGAAVQLHAVTIVGAAIAVGSRTTALNPLGLLGRRAYSVYLWDEVINRFLGPVLGTTLVLPVVFAIAELSYRLVERPLIRRYHHRLKPRKRVEGIPAAELQTPAPTPTPLVAGLDG